MPRRLLFLGYPRAVRAKLRKRYRALEASLGPFDDRAHDLAMVAAELRWTNTVATVALAEAVQRRAHGKGRRPHERAIQGLMKRQGLTFNTWQEAERKLEEMTGQQRSSVATALRRAAR